MSEKRSLTWPPTFGFKCLQNALKTPTFENILLYKMYKCFNIYTYNFKIKLTLFKSSLFNLKTLISCFTEQISKILHIFIFISEKFNFRLSFKSKGIIVNDFPQFNFFQILFVFI